jgi:cyclopropane-fatty-acyl-phospholipid synthase
MNITHRVYERLLFDTFERAIQQGHITITTPNGTSKVFAGSSEGGKAQWNIHDWKVVKALASRGDIGLGETYADGLWDSPDLDALFTVFVDNLDRLATLANGGAFSRFWLGLVNNVIRRNSLSGSSRNIRSHYDVGNSFYKLWLDPTMTYSSAIYSDTGMKLEDAQRQKYQRILERIGTDRNHILEIGCGWGGFAEEAAASGHRLTGLTLSHEQHAFANERLKHKPADIRLQDYRATGGVFDAIASIEMFEAVGKNYWPSYFDTLRARMSKDGVAMVQTITVADDVFDDYAARSDYIRHYVFPGGLLPSVARFRENAEKAGLAVKDVFAFGQDYARTLREWLARFDASEIAIRELGHGTAFIRSWRLYLAMCAASFACGRTNVVQVELRHA